MQKNEGGKRRMNGDDAWEELAGNVQGTRRLRTGEGAGTAACR